MESMAATCHVSSAHLSRRSGKCLAMADRASASVADRRDRVFAVLQTILRQRFPDMAHVGFNVVKVHPSCSMLDPLPRSQKEKVVTVYTDDVLRLNAVVLLHLKFPPYDEEGAIYTLRRLRLHTLIGQLGLEALCGQNGDSCLCYINGIELTNDIEAAVEDAACAGCFLSLWLMKLRLLALLIPPRFTPW